MLGRASEFLGERIQQPSLEFGCMDGLNTCVLLGGEFPFSYDVFEEARWDKESHLRSTLQDDYYNATKDDIQVALLKTSTQRLTVGVDWKQAHFIKAERLKVFDRFSNWDPTKGMPDVESGSVSTIWAPNIYWMPEVAFVLKELRRVLRDDGRVVTIGPDLALLRHMFFRFSQVAPQAWLNDLDRGRFQNASQNARSLEDWGKLFSAQGFSISRHDQFIPSLVGEVYDIGFRPMFAVLLNMREKIQSSSIEEMLALKREWVSSLSALSAPFCDETWMRKMGNPFLWHIFELSPR